MHQMVHLIGMEGVIKRLSVCMNKCLKMILKLVSPM